MKRISLYLAAACTMFLSHNVDAAPLLVTRTTGAVTIQKDGTSSAAPGTTFALLDGQTLQLAEGATATVVSSGRAEQIVGPKTVSTDTSIGSDDVAGHESNLDSIIKRQNSAANVGATRNQADLHVTHPIPDSRIHRLSSIQWDCKDCSVEKVELVQMKGFTPVWDTTVSKSTRKTDYRGANLEPGEYAIKINGDYYGFEVISTAESATVESALLEARRLSKKLSTTDKIAIEVGILWQYGLWSDALQTLNQALIDNPKDTDLIGLKRAYQATIQ